MESPEGRVETRKSVRLFVAIEVPGDVQQAIAGEQNRLRGALGREKRSSIKWATADHLHLTLAFLGHVDRAQAEAVVDVIRPPFDIRQFSIVFGGLGVFPPRGDPRVLWLGLKSGAADVVIVQRAVTDRLAVLSMTLEERAYHPHLTIGRWRSSRSADQRHVLAQDHGEAIARAEVPSVTLFESRLSPAGSTYIALCRAPLAGPSSR